MHLHNYVIFQNDLHNEQALQGKYGKVIGVRHLNKTLVEIDMILVEDGRKIQLGFQEQNLVEILTIVPEVNFAKVKRHQEGIEDSWVVVHLVGMASTTIIILLMLAML